MVVMRDLEGCSACCTPLSLKRCADCHAESADAPCNAPVGGGTGGTCTFCGKVSGRVDKRWRKGVKLIWMPHKKFYEARKNQLQMAGLDNSAGREVMACTTCWRKKRTTQRR